MQHEPDAGEADECESGSVEVFIVLGQAPATIDPGDGTFHDPAPWDDLETLGLGGTLDHLDPPGGIGHGPTQLRAAVGAVGEDRLQEGKEAAGVAIQNQKGAVAVLDMLLALDLLARVMARRVDARPPFSAPFTL